MSIVNVYLQYSPWFFKHNIPNFPILSLLRAPWNYPWISCMVAILLGCSNLRVLDLPGQGKLHLTDTKPQQGHQTPLPPPKIKKPPFSASGAEMTRQIRTRPCRARGQQAQVSTAPGAPGRLRSLANSQEALFLGVERPTQDPPFPSALGQLATRQS